MLQDKGRRLTKASGVCAEGPQTKAPVLLTGCSGLGGLYRLRSHCQAWRVEGNLLCPHHPHLRRGL